MLQLTPQHRLLLAIEPVDFRRGIDGLIATCRQQLACDPYSGTIFVFTNKKRQAAKILVYDGHGFWLCHRRFSKGKLKWWPTGHTATHTLRASELQVLLSQGDPRQLNLANEWRQLPGTNHQQQ